MLPTELRLKQFAIQLPTKERQSSHTISKAVCQTVTLLRQVSSEEHCATCVPSLEGFP